MSGRLPEWIKPISLADKGTQLDGALPIRSLARLGSLLHDNSGAIDVSLAFGVDVAGQQYASGKARGTVKVVCQRCLEPMDYELAAEVCLGIVADNAGADRLSSQYEPLIAGNDPVKLADLVEDELILAMPYVAFHGDGEACKANTEVGMQSDQPVEPEPANRPFDVLKQLKKPWLFSRIARPGQSAACAVHTTH